MNKKVHHYSKSIYFLMSSSLTSFNFGLHFSTTLLIIPFIREDINLFLKMIDKHNRDKEHVQINLFFWSSIHLSIPWANKGSFHLKTWEFSCGKLILWENVILPNPILTNDILPMSICLKAYLPYDQFA